MMRRHRRQTRSSRARNQEKFQPLYDVSCGGGGEDTNLKVPINGRNKEAAELTLGRGSQEHLQLLLKRSTTATSAEELARHRADALNAIAFQDATQQSHKHQVTSATITKTTTIGPGETEPLLFRFDQDLPGPNTALGCTPTTEFAIAFPELNLAELDHEEKWTATI